MELAIVITFLLYIGYREWIINQSIKDLELKLLAKNPQEYAQYRHIDKPKKEIAPKVEDELIDPFDVSAEDALKGIGDKHGRN